MRQKPILFFMQTGTKSKLTTSSFFLFFPTFFCKSVQFSKCQHPGHHTLSMVCDRQFTTWYQASEMNRNCGTSPYVLKCEYPPPARVVINPDQHSQYRTTISNLKVCYLDRSSPISIIMIMIVITYYKLLQLARSAQIVVKFGYLRGLKPKHTMARKQPMPCVMSTVTVGDQNYIANALALFKSQYTYHAGQTWQELGESDLLIWVLFSTCFGTRFDARFSAEP